MDLKWASKAGSVLYRIAALQFIFLTVAGLSLAWAGGGVSSAPVAHPARPAGLHPLPSRRHMLQSFARLPLSFEPNLGQSDPQVRFFARGHGYGLFLTDDRALLLVREPAAHTQFHTLTLRLLGSNPAAQPTASDQLQGVSNYLMGENPRQWHTNVPHYARVHYRGIYPGVDLVYYGRRQQLEYDFVVAPGADPSHIRLQVDGAQALTLDSNGDLVLHLPGGAIQLRRPQVYQQAGNRQHPVAARYILEAGNRVGFALAGYDRSRAVIIDPRLAYFSYLGGSLNETAPVVAVDSAFNAYVAGTTNSVDFPTLTPYQGTLKGTTNAFVSKFNSAGTALYFSTYLGGSGADAVAGIAVDRGFNAYLAGTTTSSDFPVTPASAIPDSPAAAGTNHVFVTELNSSGTGLVYSTYLAGNGADSARGVAVGPLAGTVFVTGATSSSNFATVAKPAGRGTNQFFVTKLNTGKQKAASLVYSTYIGGTTPSNAATDGGGIAVDPSGNAYITGGTNYTDMPVVNAYQSALSGTENAFVAKLNPNGTLPALFLTYLGGNGTDIGNGVAADSAGNVYVTGSTSSSSFPVLAATGSAIYQGAFGGGANDAFISKLASAGRTLIWSTYLGGSGDDSGLGIAVDANQNTFVTGSTTSANLNTVKPTQSANGGGMDAFVGEFDISGTAQLITYLGGGGNDRGTGIALDVDGNPYVAGEAAATSTGLATAGVYQTTPKGGSDAFVAHFTGVSTLALAATATPNPVGIGNAAAFTFTITNTGPDIATAIVFTDTLPTNGTYQSVSASQGTCSAPAGSTLACSLGQLPLNGVATVIVHIAGTAVGPLSDTGTVSSSSTTGSASAGASATVTDFAVSVNPPTANTPAGQAATYTVTVSPLPQGATFPNGVSLKCSGGVPTAALCAFSTDPVVPGATPVTSSLTISTTALPPGLPTAFLFKPNSRRTYALLLPLGGIAFLGFSLGGDQRRRTLSILVLGLLLLLTVLQPACGSSNTKPTIPPFTPKGTYNITVSAVSGTVTRTTKLVMVVQ